MRLSAKITKVVSIYRTRQLRTERDAARVSALERGYLFLVKRRALAGLGGVEDGEQSEDGFS